MLYLKLKKYKKNKYKFVIFENNKLNNYLGTFVINKNLNKFYIFIDFFKFLFYINKGINFENLFYKKNLKIFLIYFLNFLLKKK